ncbi:MAG: YicC/YloC family endoribonuclease [Thermodesulfovibrionales bacterium]
MTGFGSAEKDGCRIEVRSLNHKFLDISVKAPSFLNQLEIPFRNIIRDSFSRGKFDIAVVVSGEAATDLRINTELVKKTHGAFRQLQEQLNIPGEIDINALIALHDMFMEKDQHLDPESITAIFRQALDDLLAMRTREGKSLTTELRRLTAALQAMTEQVRGSCGSVLQGAHEKFSERIRLLLEGREIDSSRILQEAAIMAAKIDITEELARLDSHIRQFDETLNRGGIIGRKLDFILQECNREANTIASKSVDFGISGLTVEMKTVIEQLREQVQNIQ